jgi:hypothetical protein
MTALYWPKDWISDDAAICELLASWRGFDAQVWEYVVSHGQLMLRLYGRGYGEGLTKNCYLYCQGCERVEFDAWWKDPNIQISTSQRNDGARERRMFTLTDGSRLRVECRVLGAAESDQPIWIQRAPDLC